MPTSHPPKKPVASDWHPSDVKAAVEKAGWSLRQLGFAHGYSGDSALSEVFRRPWPKVERIIAKTIGVSHPMVIWPSRYNPDGTTNRRIGRLPKRPDDFVPTKSTSADGAGNRQARRVA